MARPNRPLRCGAVQCGIHMSHLFPRLLACARSLTRQHVHDPHGDALPDERPRGLGVQAAHGRGDEPVLQTNSSSGGSIVGCVGSVETGGVCASATYQTSLTASIGPSVEALQNLPTRILMPTPFRIDQKPCGDGAHSHTEASPRVMYLNISTRTHTAQQAAVAFAWKSFDIAGTISCRGCCV